MKKLLLCLVITFLFLSSEAQDIDYARRIIDSLCSPRMQGRGYAHGGDRLAALFIRSELKKHKVEGFTKNYFQPFTMAVNTFPDDVEVRIGWRKLQAGVDYLVASYSGNCEGKYRLVRLDKSILSDSKELKKFIKKDLSDTYVLFDTVGMHYKKDDYFPVSVLRFNALKARGIVEVFDKNLTYYPSRMQENFAHIQVKREALPLCKRKIKVDIDARFRPHYQTQNVVGFIKGQTDSFVVFSAHYDHVGMMGDNCYFPGAHDNASGVSMALDLARHFSNKKPAYNIAFLFFSGEEAGLLGSKYYTQHPLFDLSKIKFLFNLDLIGSGDEGIKVVNGSVFKPQFDKLRSINKKNDYLPQIKIRGAAANSDHYFFYEKGVPCFFIYTLGSYKEYHNIYDKAEAVPLSKYNGLFRLLVDFVAAMPVD